MKTFPQLATGAIAQYPVESAYQRRTVINETADGRQMRWPDLGSPVVRWECALTEMSVGEWSAVCDLFREVEGRWKTFTFFSPFENLLSWSEDFARGIWVKEPLLSVVGGISDPTGGSSASRIVNGAAVSRSLSQGVQVPSQYVSCFSLWIRNGSVVLTRAAAGMTQSQGFSAGAQWKRVHIGGAHSMSADTTVFGVQAGAGSSCEIFGAQLDLQSAPGEYLRSAARSGVYVNARFDEDRLSAVALGPGRTQTTIRVIARVED